MQTSEIAAQVVAILAPAMSGSVNLAQGVATRVLGDLISKRLSRDDAGKRAWSEFEQDPRNESLVRHLLRQELERDAAFREQVTRQLAQVSREPRAQGPVKQEIGADSHGNFQVGGSVGKIAHSGGHIDDSVHSTTHNKKTANGTSVAGIVAVVVVVVLALVIYGGAKVIGGLHKSAKDDGLTANSTCQQFLNTDEEDERQAIADIGLSMGYSAYSNPMALPEMQYECGGAPSQTLGDRIRQDGPNG
jgi:hypothetical protein